MKSIAFTLMIMIAAACSANAEVSKIFSADTTNRIYLSAADAEKITGQKSRLTEHSGKNKDGVIQYKGTYLAGPEVVLGGRPCYLYFSVTKYPTAAVAQKIHADILTGNQGMPGQKLLNNIGDEAWLHTDGSNFALIVLRKGDMMLRIKINKLTPKVSLEELQRVAGRVVAAF